MKTGFKWAVAATAVAVLVACGGGGSEPPKVASSNTTIAASATTMGAVANADFSFPSGVPAFGTTAPTTFKVSGSGTALNSSISSGGKTASGNLGFGSCVITITTSTFEAGHPLAAGAQITVNPCAISLNTAGLVTSDSASTPVGTTITLGAAVSTPTIFSIRISPSGQVTVGNTPVGFTTIIGGSGAI